MKRIVYRIVIAPTGEDNEKMNYKTIFRSPKIEDAKKYAEKTRKENNYAFIVLEEIKEAYDNSFGLWEPDFEAEENVKVLEHY